MATSVAGAAAPSSEHGPRPDRLALPAREGAQVLGIGLTKFRELIAEGELRTIRVGRRLLVPRSEIEHYVERKLGEAS